MIDQALPQPPSMLINPQTGMQNKGDATGDMFRAENARMKGQTLATGPIQPNAAWGNYFNKVTGDNGGARSFQPQTRLNANLGQMNFGALKPFAPTQSLGLMNGGQLNGQFQQPALQNFHADMSWLEDLLGNKGI